MTAFDPKLPLAERLTSAGSGAMCTGALDSLAKIEDERILAAICCHCQNYVLVSKLAFDALGWFPLDFVEDDGAAVAGARIDRGGLKNVLAQIGNEVVETALD